MDWLKENYQLLLPLITFLTGWLLPNSLIFAFGKKTGKNIPKELRKLIAEKLDALERGLLDADVEGNKEVVDNNKVQELIKGTKIDLGLDGVEIKKK
jgi:hypothetical protein